MKTNTNGTKAESKTVEVTIDGKKYQIKPGKYPVARIKNKPDPKIPQEDTLCMLIDGRVTSVEDKGHIEIVGGEVFVSNCPSGGAS